LQWAVSVLAGRAKKIGAFFLVSNKALIKAIILEKCLASEMLFVFKDAKNIFNHHLNVTRFYKNLGG
jgi:hypothetical protein